MICTHCGKEVAKFEVEYWGGDSYCSDICIKAAKYEIEAGEFRDRVALEVLKQQSELSKLPWYADDSGEIEIIAEGCYAMANAMLKARGADTCAAK